MLNTYIRLFIAVGGGAAVWFAIQAGLARASRTTTNRVEQRQRLIEDARRRRSRPTIRARISTWLTAQGYQGDPRPLITAFGVFYLFCVLALELISFPLLFSVLLSLPLSLGAVYFTSERLATNRKRRFNQELMSSLQRLSGLLQGGSGRTEALSQVVRTSDNPFRSEMTRVLESEAGTKDLVSALRPLGDRYPSRGFTLFISALEAAQEQGGALAPSIELAYDLIQKDFAIAQEATAEMASERQQFIGLVILELGIAAFIYKSGGPSAHTAFTTAPGVFVLIAGLVNFGIGCLRITRIIAKAGASIK